MQILKIIQCISMNVYLLVKSYLGILLNTYFEFSRTLTFTCWRSPWYAIWWTFCGPVFTMEICSAAIFSIISLDNLWKNKNIVDEILQLEMFENVKSCIRLWEVFLLLLLFSFMRRVTRSEVTWRAIQIGISNTSCIRYYFWKMLTH